MRWPVVLLLGAAYCICQVLANVPPKEDLCGMIVDRKVEKRCLQCFSWAGHISQHPEKVRKCTATHLPPDLAECSVPHVGKSVRIHQGGGDYHSNHTNANYLPSCLQRRLRGLKDYQQREEKFVSQASQGLKYIMKSTLVDHGAPTILSVQAMASILQLPGIKHLARESVSACRDKYISERHWKNDIREETEGHELEDLMEVMKHDLTDEMEDNDGWNDEMEEDNELMKRSLRAAGNHLPFGGTNSFARRVMLYQCITSSLFESGAGAMLLETVMHDDFFLPVPEWWVKPLLMIAKSVAYQNK